jgi:hypothetical protein
MLRSPVFSAAEHTQVARMNNISVSVTKGNCIGRLFTVRNLLFTYGGEYTGGPVWEGEKGGWNARNLLFA